MSSVIKNTTACTERIEPFSHFVYLLNFHRGSFGKSFCFSPPDPTLTPYGLKTNLLLADINIKPILER